MQPSDFHRLGRIVESIEAAGGRVQDAEIDRRERGDIFSKLTHSLSGQKAYEPVFTLEIRAGLVPGDDVDEEELRDLIDGLEADGVIGQQRAEDIHHMLDRAIDEGAEVQEVDVDG